MLLHSRSRAARLVRPRAARSLVGVASVLGSWACGGAEDRTFVVGPGAPAPAAGQGAGEAPAAVGSPESQMALFPTSSVVFSAEGETTYVNVMSSLARQPDPSGALELLGWADLWVHGGKVFIADGESPVMTRYSVDGAGELAEEGRLSFQNYGATQIGFTSQIFVQPSKAYWFNTGGREVVAWNPETLATGATFPLPELADRGDQRLAGPSADRSSVVRGDRAYVPFYWANWDDYALSDDSVIVVLDTQRDTVVSVINVPCPEINFASVDDAGTIYFSNWGFSAVPAVLDGRARACAVRIPAGSDALDSDWSLAFADVTDGREASALRWIGDGKALLTVFHDERATIAADTDRFALTDSANWRLWTLDLESLAAAPLETLGWHAPGLYGARIGPETFLFVPSADYASTTAYRFSLDGTAEVRWQSRGWQTRLFEIPR